MDGHKKKEDVGGFLWIEMPIPTKPNKPSKVDLLANGV